MEKELDLTIYIDAILQNWYWIVGTAILASILTFVIFSLSPTTYSATATIVVLKSGNVIELDNRLREIQDTQAFSSLPQLAKSNDILKELLVQFNSSEINSISDLDDVLEVESEDNGSIILLTSTLENPTEAARLTNLWAVLFVDWSNNVFRNTSEEQVKFFEEQRTIAQENLLDSEQKLIKYQGTNQIEIFSNTLVSYNQAQSNYLAEKNQTKNLIQSTISLRDLVASQANNSPVSFADQLAILVIQLQLLDVEIDPSLQYQLDSNSTITTNSRNEQLEQIDSILEILHDKIAQIDSELLALNPDILELQEKIQVAETEYNRLLLNKQVAEETFTALSRKVAEERIAYADTAGGIQLASQAILPEQADSKNKILNGLIAGIISGFLATIIVIIHTWWKQSTYMHTTKQ